MNLKLLKKACTAVVATAMLLNTSVLSSFFVSAEETRYEFEDGVIRGSDTAVMTDEPGYSGDGYVYLKSAGDTISIDVEVPSTGMYDLSICHHIPTDSTNKIQFIYINGVNQGEVAFSINEKFTESSIGAFKLNAGKNTIKIESSWGWTMFDYLTVAPAKLAEFSASGTLCDPQATTEAKQLMAYLADMYGSHIISGQQEFYGTSRNDEFDYIYNLSGKYPAIRGFDFGETCPLYAWDAGAAERAISWVNDKGGIATASWHINVPTVMSEYTLGSTMPFDRTTYSEKTNFVTANVVKSGTVEHDYFLLAVENLAKELKKLQNANVPLIFRPFHEAEGNGGINGEGAWFWWSKEGAAVYKELYIYLYNILTEQYGLHNLIWEFNSYVYDNSYAWYPGAQYVDIVGYDKYNATNWNTGQTSPNESAIASVFYGLVDMYNSDGKPIAMAENDTIPNLDNLIGENAGWLYFCPWYGDHLMNTNYNNPNTVKELYQSEYVITLDEVPNLSDYEVPDVGPTKPTKPTEPTEPTTEEPKFDIKYYDIDLSGRTETNTLLLEFEGTPEADINGCVGYSVGAKWYSIEWESKLDSKGKATVSVDISDIPENVTTAQAQIWWAATWDEATETITIAENDLIDYSFGAADDDVLYGDVNVDGKVLIDDVVMVLSYSSNPDAVTVSEQGLINADVYQKGDGIQASDAASIQKYLTKAISKLPESFMN